ncbi:hypothetical protein [Ensifer adhaerens]|uniref:hypothetical protein n=1 Tax=Ensifer adhaerens TaxID=106592 RepID=UPI001F3C2A8A|nr:hypothetical protein [Ensifer adhaerens]
MIPKAAQLRTENRFALFLEFARLAGAIPNGKPLRTFPGIRSLGWRNSGRKTASHFSWNSLAWLAQFRTENRYALFLEFARLAGAIPDGKPLRTFPGIRSLGWRNSGRKTATHFSWNSLAWLAQFRTENRYALFLEFARLAGAIPDGKPLRTFPGIRSLGWRNSGRKTATHFSWNSLAWLAQFRTENRYALFLEFARLAGAIPDGKPLRTFPGIRSLGWRNSGRKTATHFSWNSLAWLAQFRTENRYALFLEFARLAGAIPDGKPLRTFPGIALRQ